MGFAERPVPDILLRICYLLRCSLSSKSLVTAFFMYQNSLIKFQCSWPELSAANEDMKITINNIEEPVKAMFIADTHLLGTRRGHWFDKLRR